MGKYNHCWNYSGKISSVEFCPSFNNLYCKHIQLNVFFYRVIPVDRCHVKVTEMENGFWLALLAGVMDVEDHVSLVSTQKYQILHHGFTNMCLQSCNLKTVLLE